ncbi:MAG: DNA-binding protein HU [Deltaproteobacteria bacterium RBG_13_52_11]|nr:MAG: DNA-binding protein HU [Deltaproteobacteria bacterium RBG_13_52_11]
MTKSEVIDKVAKEAKIPRAAAERAVNSFTATITEVLKTGDKITLPGFGTFQVSNRSARKGRNPRTGQEIDIPAVKIPKFKVGKGLKDAVR